MIRRIKSTWLWFRQPVSGLSHLVGAILATIGLIWLLSRLGVRPFESKVIATLIFCLSMVFLYLSSSLYHLLPLGEKGIQRLRKLDHSAIYIFIAGSYTPVCLLLLREGKGPVMFYLAWIAASLGVVFKLLWMERSRWLRVGIYLAMSLMSIVMIPEIIAKLPMGGLLWLLGGILSYGVGAIVYAFKWPDPLPEVVGFHELWHGFVMVGGFCHFWLLKEYLLT